MENAANSFLWNRENWPCWLATCKMTKLFWFTFHLHDIFQVPSGVVFWVLPHGILPLQARAVGTTVIGKSIQEITKSKTWSHVDLPEVENMTDHWTWQPLFYRQVSLHSSVRSLHLSRKADWSLDPSCSSESKIVSPQCMDSKILMQNSLGSRSKCQTSYYQ